MKVEYKNYSIDIIPEDAKDEVYLESVLDLHNKGDQAIAERIAPMGLDHAWAYLKIRRDEKESTEENPYLLHGDELKRTEEKAKRG